MATRARIGILMKNGMIKSVYHHWDGYPGWLGRKLEENYTTYQKIHALMRDGDISSIESHTDFNNNKIKGGPKVLYYKSRGENSPSRTFWSFNHFKRAAKNNGCEYIYLFKNKKWEWYAI